MTDKKVDYINKFFKKTDNMWEKYPSIQNNPVKKILFSNLLFGIIFLFVVFPLFLFTAPRDEASFYWAFPLARLLYIVIVVPLFFAYSSIVLSNTHKVNKSRCVVWTTTFVVYFCAFHLFLFAFLGVNGMWLLFFTLPLGLIWLLTLCLKAIYLDNKKD